MRKTVINSDSILMFGIWHLSCCTLHHSPSAQCLGKLIGKPKCSFLVSVGSSNHASLRLYIGTYTPAPACKHHKSQAFFLALKTIFRPAWEPALFSTERFFMLIRNLFISSWCIWGVIKLNIQTKKQTNKQKYPHRINIACRF